MAISQVISSSTKITLILIFLVMLKMGLIGLIYSIHMVRVHQAQLVLRKQREEVSTSSDSKESE